MSERPSRRRLSRLEKLLRGSINWRKYPLPGVVIALAGCVPPNQFIAISPDGRYALVPFNEKGPSLAYATNGRLLRIDLQTLHATAVSPEHPAHFWIDTAGNTTVTSVDTGTGFGLLVLFNGEKQSYENLAFPALSPDGKTLYATRNVEPELDDLPAQASGPIVAIDLITGQQTDLGITGFAASVSPDGKHLAFIGPANDDDSAWSIRVRPTAEGETKQLARFNPDLPWFFKPRWCDDQTLLYRGYADDSPEDTDVYTVTLDGKAQQLTANNTISEAYPQPASDGKIVWLAVPGKAFDPEQDDPLTSMRGKITVATPTVGGQYTIEQLRYQAYALAVRGDTLLFVDYDNNEQRPSLWKLDLTRPNDAAVNLSDDILREVKGLPEAD